MVRHSSHSLSSAPAAAAQDSNGEQYNEQQEVTCTATGGYFTLTFRDFTTETVAYDASAEDVASALQALPSLYGRYDTAVDIQFSATETQACTAAGHSWTVEFLQDFGDLPLLVAGASRLTHSTSGVSAGVAVQEAVQGTKESKNCSGRGLCDHDEGVCTCEVEFDSSNGYNEEVGLRPSPPPPSLTRYPPSRAYCLRAFKALGVSLHQGDRVAHALTPRLDPCRPPTLGVPTVFRTPRRRDEARPSDAPYGTRFNNLNSL